MDNKFSVKFESGLYEQTYKFRSGDAVENLADIKKIVDLTFCDQVLQQLAGMHKIKNQALAKVLSSNEAEEFEAII